MVLLIFTADEFGAFIQNICIGERILKLHYYVLYENFMEMISQILIFSEWNTKPEQFWKRKRYHNKFLKKKSFYENNYILFAKETYTCFLSIPFHETRPNADFSGGKVFKISQWLLEEYSPKFLPE